MKTEEFLTDASAALQKAGIPTARLDVLVLLEDVLNTNRTHLLAEPEHDITEVQLTKLRKLVKKRAQHIPLAYLRGQTEFYGRTFLVNKHVLEPRPESETMIDMYKTLDFTATQTVADIGTGSGALGITAALEKPGQTVCLLEIDTAALAVAVQNIKLHNLSVRVLQSDLLSGTNEQFDVLLCNLPYVPDDYDVNAAASHEPAIALYGGADGLEIYRRLFHQLATRPHRPSYVLTESLPVQHEALLEIASEAGFFMSREDDFIQLFQPL